MSKPKTHWREVLQTRYLGGADLDDGNMGHKEVDLTIKQAKRETVEADGRKEEKLVVHWEEKAKPMILNVTNTEVISMLAGSPYLQDWAGLKVRIGTEKVKAFGEVHDALRIRKKRIQVQQVPTCSDCKKEVPGHQGADPKIIADAYKQLYGVPLCYECGQKRKAEPEVTSEPDGE